MKLSDFELAVMQVMWAAKSLTVPRLHDQIGPARNVSYSTVKTIVDRLEEKGALRRQKMVGRTIVYEPAISGESLSKPMVRSFIQKLFGGNVRPLFNHALAEENITIEDIAYLEEILASKKRSLSEDDHD